MTTNRSEGAEHASGEAARQALASGRTALAITLGVIGILTFAAALLSVSWIPARLDVLLGAATSGLAFLLAALALGRA